MKNREHLSIMVSPLQEPAENYRTLEESLIYEKLLQSISNRHPQSNKCDNEHEWNNHNNPSRPPKL